MSKGVKILAVWVLALVVSSLPAFAVEIDIYGVGHVSGDYISNGDNGTVVFSSNSSRLGVKASQKIIGDFKIVGQYESGIDLTGVSGDDGNGGAARDGILFTRARDSFVGIVTPYGCQLNVGRLAAHNKWMYDYNLFADQIGDLGNILGAGGIDGGPGRADAAIEFVSREIYGFNLAVLYPSNLTNTGNEDQRFLAKLNYDSKKGFKAGVGYAGLYRDDNDRGSENQFVVTAGYAQDSFSIGAGYSIMMNIDATEKDQNRHVWYVGASYAPIADLTLKGHYAMLLSDIDKSGASMFAVGADYALAAKTTVYIAYAMTLNDENAAYSANNWGHGRSASGAPVAGDDPMGVSLGLVYKFGGTVFKN